MRGGRLRPPRLVNESMLHHMMKHNTTHKTSVQIARFVIFPSRLFREDKAAAVHTWPTRCQSGGTIRMLCSKAVREETEAVLG